MEFFHEVVRGKAFPKNQDIFWFDIPMNHIQGLVKVNQCAKDLNYQAKCLQL